MYDGKTFSWFLDANPRLIYYNARLFKQSGVPLPPKKWEKSGWTFEDFVDTARRLTNLEDATPVCSVVVYDHTGNEQIFSINKGSPSGVYSKDGLRFTLADPPGYEAIQSISDPTHEHRVGRTRQVVSENRNVATMFNNQMLSVRFTSTGSINALGRDAKFAWDVTPVPMKAKRMGEGSIQTYALAVGAQNPDNGWHLLQFFTGPEVSRIFIDNGYAIPANKTFTKDYIAANEGKNQANMDLTVESLNYQTLDTQVARRVYRGDILNEIGDGKVTAAALEPDWIAHLVSHASTGITVLLLAGLLVYRFRRKMAGAGPPWAWRVLLTGLLVLGGAQLVEALSARLEYPDSGVLHETSGLASALALGVVVVSGVVVAGSSKRLPPRRSTRC